MKFLISLIVLFSPILSLAQPADDLIRSYIVDRSDLTVSGGKISSMNPDYIKLDSQTYQLGGNHRLRFSPESFDGSAGWRLTEILVNQDESVTASTSTFSKNAVRSVTRCFSNGDNGVSGDMSCATASKRICSGLTRFFKGSNQDMSVNDAINAGINPQIVRQVEAAKKRLGSELELGKVCTAFSSYLSGVNGLIAKAPEIKSMAMLGYPYLNNPFSEVEDRDRAVLKKETKSLRRWSDLNFEGAFLQEAEDRSNALNVAARSFRVSSEILNICRTSNFDQGPASSGTVATPAAGEK